MAETQEAETPSKPKALIVDKKFSPEDLKIPRNQAYVRDLGQCFKIFQKWGFDIIWVESGADAMKALRMYLKDIRNVIIEAYVPGGGLTVARLIRFKPDCKHIPVFLMSEHLTEKDLKEGTRLGVFDCLVRPFQDLKFLEDRLQKGAEVQGEIAVEEANIDPKSHIVKELEKITNLPAMPTVYNEIEKLSRNPESTTEQYSQVIEVDPGITAQMLRLCNSSAFSFTRKITSINDAVNLLGLQTVIDFVVPFLLWVHLKVKPTAFDATEFWKHCIAVGVAAKLLMGKPEFATKFNLDGEDPFMAGMVHDIGKQVLDTSLTKCFKWCSKSLRVVKPCFLLKTAFLA